MKQTLQKLKQNTEATTDKQMDKELVLDTFKELLDEIRILENRYDVTDQSQCTL